MQNAGSSAKVTPKVTRVSQTMPAKYGIIVCRYRGSVITCLISRQQIIAESNRQWFCASQWCTEAVHRDWYRQTCYFRPEGARQCINTPLFLVSCIWDNDISCNF